jgi:hypothetical protein
MYRFCLYLADVGIDHLLKVSLADGTDPLLDDLSTFE